MKKEFDLIVKNNPKNPGTIIENAVILMVLGMVLFFIPVAIKQGDYNALCGLLIFSTVPAFLLYHNNAVCVKISGEVIFLRKFLRIYKYDLDDFDFAYESGIDKIVIVFKGNSFSYLKYYQNIFELLDLLRNRKNPFAKEAAAEAIKEFIKQKTGKITYNLEAEFSAEDDIFSSKIGGMPYWDFAKDYPTDVWGNKMTLLCQLNFEENEFSDELLPQTGIMQFFIAEKNDVFGINFEDYTTQNNWRIIYHETIDKSVTPRQIEKLGITRPPNPELYYQYFCSSPIIKPCKLKFCQTVSYMHEDDPKFNKVLSAVVKELSGEDFEGTLDDLLGKNSVYSAQIRLLIENTENHLLGYPWFIQNDPREDMPEQEAEYFDTVLLHLDSAAADGHIMCWGDGGTCNFLINSQALKNRDFSKVLYYWDCF